MLALTPLPVVRPDWMPDWCLACNWPAERLLVATEHGRVVQQLPVCIQHGAEILIQPEQWTPVAVLGGPPQLKRKDQT